ncbi:MAG TPA: hypothetical protein VF062_05505 [Candidatus Limnocylindrales bacterium]
MLSLSLDMLRSRWAGLIGTFFALLAGSMMLAMAALVFTSAQPQVPQRLSAASIVVGRGYDASFIEPPRLPETEAASLIAELEAIPGVRQAIADTPFYAQAVIDGTAARDTAGNSWAALALSSSKLVAGRGPATDGEVAVGSALGLAPGDGITILTARGPSAYTVSGVVDGHGYFFSKPLAGVRGIGLLTDPTVDLTRVERAWAGGEAS